MSLLAFLIITIPTIIKVILDGDKIEDNNKSPNHLKGNFQLATVYLACIPLWYFIELPYPYMAWVFPAMFHILTFNYMLNLYRRHVKGNESITWHHLGNGFYDRILKLGGNWFGIIIIQLLIASAVYTLYYLFIYYEV